MVPNDSHISIGPELEGPLELIRMKKHAEVHKHVYRHVTSHVASARLLPRS